LPGPSTSGRLGASSRWNGWRGLRLDEGTIRAFLATEYPRIVGAVALVAGSRAAAEDAVQEALARAWERTDRGEGIDSLPAWVTRVAMNLSRSALRRLRAELRARERLAAAAPTAETAGAEVRVDLAASGRWSSSTTTSGSPWGRLRGRSASRRGP